MKVFKNSIYWGKVYDKVEKESHENCFHCVIGFPQYIYIYRLMQKCAHPPFVQCYEMLEVSLNFNHITLSFMRSTAVVSRLVNLREMKGFAHETKRMK